MPAQWTGPFVAKMHMNRVTVKRLAGEMNIRPEYVGAILNGKRNPAGAEQRFNAALDRIVAAAKLGG